MRKMYKINLRIVVCIQKILELILCIRQELFEPGDSREVIFFPTK